ncbi:HU family DNA-binding protein [uncultured Bacteroides sp.]|uniref:HU family DNA-binding protein n=1 Tax=uncultured Bacteroides sp. TaxID=162156 RepID=UPI002AA7CBFD|nr:HU family DNA-binding protein [uncultured Bacteroides sp.]
MNERLNMQNLIDLLAEKRNIGKGDADIFIRDFFTLIEQALENDKYVKIKGLGIFKLIDVESRESINVNTGERFEIQSHTKISFSPEQTLRDSVNKPFAHFETVILNEDTVLDNTLVEDIEEELEDGKESDSKEEVEKVTLDTTKAPSEEILETNSMSEDKVETAIPSLSAEKEKEESLSLLGEKKISVEDIIAKEIRKADEEYKIHRQKNKESHEEVAFSERGRNKSLMFYTAILVVLITVAGAIAYIYYPNVMEDLFTANNETTSTTMSPTPDLAGVQLSVDTFNMETSAKNKMAINSDSTESDSIKKVLIKKTIGAILPAKTSIEVREKQKREIDTDIHKEGLLIPDSVNYTIIGTKTTYAVKEGETLTRIALRFYGTKNLWPYIVKHNRNLIKNPNNVPYGTVLKIPELKRIG